MEGGAQKRDNHTPSCTVCQRRKVKCDRRYPCAACQKSGLECLFDPTARERKRVRKNNEPGEINQHMGQNFNFIKPDPSAELLAPAASSQHIAHQIAPTSLRHAQSQSDIPRAHSLQDNVAYHGRSTPDAAASLVANPIVANATVPTFTGSATGSNAGSVGYAASAPAFPSPESTGGVPNTALLVPDGSGLRYVNNYLWSAISSEAHVGTSSPVTSPEDGPQSSGAEERSRNASLDDLAPTPESSITGRNFLFGGKSHLNTEEPIPANHIVYLWHTYLANVDPITRVSHSPAVQQIVLGQIGRPSTPPNEMALVAAIYLAAVVSLTEELCVERLQDSRHSLIRRFREATEVHLSAASFLTSTDVGVLQALVLYLSAMRSIGEVQMVWTIFGLAIRIAGTMGLARDGASFGLSPFETEMRRRLWWCIVYLDGRMAELVGQDGDLMGVDFDVLQPSNFNDSDLFAAMQRLPEPRKTPTESIYMVARTLCCASARSLHKCANNSGTWSRLHDTALSKEDKIAIVEKIERRFSEEIIETCDPTVPIQWLSINTVRTFASKLRLIARVPVIESDKDWEMADGYSENAFILSMDLMQLQLDLWNEPMVQNWRWHWQAHFQWYALVCLLRQTRLRRGGPGISKAWKLIKQAFEVIIPTLELGPRKSLLLEGIHVLLNAARTQQEAQSGTMEAVCPSVTTPNANGSSTPYRHVPSFSTGYGSRPHSALLPGMEFAPPPVLIDPFNRIDMESTTPDPSLGFHLDGIDWVELDRLASELCQQ